MSSSVDPTPHRRVQRRARGTQLKPVDLTYRVENAAKTRFEAIASRSGMTGALFFEAMVENQAITAAGTPFWAPPKDVVQRRKRGTMVDPVPLTYKVEEDSKTVFEQRARLAGMTGALYFEASVLHLELTDQGIPSWVPPLDRDGELPIDTV